MDFFGHQEQARRQTWRLVVLYLLAVVAIVVTLDVVIALLWRFFVDKPHRGGLFAGVPKGLYVMVTAGALLTIIGGTVSRVIALGGGGRSVAEMVGARLVRRDTQDPAERRFLNIVEEMALASGIAVPQVYVMDKESGINAFAAGYSPNEAVVAVTRGTLDTLSRDELQGVVGHEFSHILNGDMRLNVRLLGVLAGISMIGSFGFFLMRVAGQASREDSRSSGLFVPGAAIAAIGYIGVFFASLIKAAVARQREFLADASAVQFTRNPEGIGNALLKIANTGSRIQSRHAEELSHMFFGDAMGLSRLFASHPPIDERVERVLGKEAAVAAKWRERRERAAPEPAAAAAVPSTEWGRRPAAGAAAAISGLTSAGVVASVGNPTEAHVDKARQWLDDLPQAVREGVRSPEGARAALFALFAGTGEVRTRQRALVTEAYGAPTADRMTACADALTPLGAALRMPVFDLTVPTLQVEPQDARDRLLATIDALARADGRVQLGEFVLISLCRRFFGADVRRPPPVKHKDLDPLVAETRTVLSLLDYAGGGEPAAFVAAMVKLGFPGQSLVPREALTVSAVESALYELKLLAPLKKPAFVKAAVEIVLADGKIGVSEGELLRAVCAAIDSPLPPILADAAPSWRNE